ncbi:MAG: hypothetical protein ACOC2N_02400 [Spirochaetota bacterium]
MSYHRRRAVIVVKIVGSLAILVAFVSGCAVLPGIDDSTPESERAVPVRIARVEGVYENIDPTFWSPDSSRRDYSLFLNLWVYLDVDPSSRVQPVDVRVYDWLNNFWTLELRDVGYHSGEPIGGWIRLRDDYMSDNGSMLALRGMRVRVELTDGTTIEKPLAFPPPAASTVDERFLVSEDYRGELTRDHAFALERASVVSADLDQASLRVVFDSVDRRVTNGQILLLSADRELLAESEDFYNNVSREPRSILNGGTRLRTGEENWIAVDLRDLSWTREVAPSEIQYVYLKLRDGGQFAFTDRSASYLHLSRSRLFPIDTQ